MWVNIEWDLGKLTRLLWLYSEWSSVDGFVAFAFVGAGWPPAQ